MFNKRVIQRKGRSHILHIKNEAINIWLEREYKIDLEECVSIALKNHREAISRIGPPFTDDQDPPTLDGLWARDELGWFRLDE